jgi:DNA polymerase elongation subunit (family B)
VALSVTGQGRNTIRNVGKKIEQAKYGKIVYGDTDSVFVRLWNIPKTEYARIPAVAKEIENFINKDFEGTVMRIEVERLLITFHKEKKQYASIYIDKKDGSIIWNIDKMYIKGMSPVRGDRILILKEMLKQIIYRILRSETFKSVALYILETLKEILAGEVPAHKFYAIMKVGTTYASENARMKVFSDKLRRSGRPIVPGEKLKFITILESFKNQNLGDRSVLDSDYEKEPDKYNIDYKYYIRQNIANQVDDIMEIAYGDIIDKHYSDHSEMRASNRCKMGTMRRMVKMVSKMIDYGKTEALQQLIDYINNKEVLEEVIDPDLEVGMSITKV